MKSKKSKSIEFDEEVGIPTGGTAVAKIVDFGETKNHTLASPLTKEVSILSGPLPSHSGTAHMGVKCTA